MDHSRVLEYSSTIQEEFKELSAAAKAKDWGEFLLELTDVLYLVTSLAQEASLETVLSAAFSLKHAASIGSHLWLAIVEASAQRVALKPPA